MRKKEAYILRAFTKGMSWIKNNTVDGCGITHSSTVRKPYPEVTGYYIPSLLQWGERELACKYGDWLISIQTTEGAWQELELKTIYTFDTGQILKGLYALLSLSSKYEDSFIKGCDWLMSQIDNDGRVHTPTNSHFASCGSEYIHLYAIEPLKLAAVRYKRPEYEKAYKRALFYYLQKKDLVNFNILSHFHAYIIEALIDLGEQELALKGLKSLNKYRCFNRAIPAFYNVKWICLTAMLQYAVCYYKLGMLAEGNACLNYAISKQNTSGGFYGGFGWFVKYFKNIEISWPVKYLLDAIYLRLRLEFIDKAESFIYAINKNDGRYIILKDTVSTFERNVKLLDVGCGKGRFIRKLLEDNFIIDVTAIDITDTLFKYLPENCKKVVGNICNMPFENEQFDVVFCCEVLEHALNIEAAVKELSRVCRVGGIIIIIIDKDMNRNKKANLESWEQYFDMEYLKNLMSMSGMMVEVKSLSWVDGLDMHAWIGTKRHV